MPSQLPIDALDPNYRVGVTLNNTPYLLDIRWNGSDEAWYMNVLDVTEDPILLGVKLVLGTYFGLRCTDPRFPRGVMFAEDLSGEGRDATIDDLGSRVVIFHYTVEEFEDITGT